jgi:hypothetical protein
LKKIIANFKVFSTYFEAKLNQLLDSGDMENLSLFMIEAESIQSIDNLLKKLQD